jgi:hypothetical protein
MTAQQSAQLLPTLFDDLGTDRCIRVLHLGPALPETVEFFSGNRCTLYFTDPFPDLPLEADLERNITLRDRVESVFELPAGAQFDLCLFWDLLNYLGEEGVSLLGEQLRPHIGSHTLAHGFAVHNLRSPQRDCTFSIVAPDSLVIRERPTRVRGYAPLPPSRLKDALGCLEMKRTVLLADGRLEMLLAARP